MLERINGLVVNKSKDLIPVELLSPSELIDTWADAIEQDTERPLTTCMPSIDKDIRNKLRGTVAAYIGYGGTKKSLLALQACKENVQSHMNNCTGIYANMEMAIYQFMNRLIDMSFSVEDCNYNASWYYENHYEKSFKLKDKDQMLAVRNILKDFFNNHYGKNLYINSKTGNTIDDFHRMILKAKEKNGKIDMLVIDGLSMMAGIGNETESYSTNSKELKDLAKLHNIYIPLICHLSKGAEKHTREVQRFIRGSEKILDNVDFVIQMSLIVDEINSIGNTNEYLTDKGYVRFYNKRGTGNTIDLIYNFNKTNLTINETPEDPRCYNSKDKSKF